MELLLPARCPPLPRPQVPTPRVSLHRAHRSDALACGNAFERHLHSRSHPLHASRTCGPFAHPAVSELPHAYALTRICLTMCACSRVHAEWPIVSISGSSATPAKSTAGLKGCEHQEKVRILNPPAHPVRLNPNPPVFLAPHPTGRAETGGGRRSHRSTAAAARRRATISNHEYEQQQQP